MLAHVIHVDETTSTINGARWWLHVAGTDTLTAYHLHLSRGRAAVTEFDVLPAFGGTVVHDALSAYDAYPQARQALCCAHISRELAAAAEADSDQTWPEQALRALHGLNTAAHHAREEQLSAIPPEIADPLLDPWRHALLVGLAEHRRVPGRRQSRTHNLLERLRDRDEQLLLFARDLSVPFINNQAKRNVRPTKTQLKISGCPSSAPRRRHRQPLKPSVTCRPECLHGDCHKIEDMQHDLTVLAYEMNGAALYPVAAAGIRRS